VENWRKGTTPGPKRRWEDIIRMDLREIGWEVVDWMHVAQDGDQWRALLSTTEPSGVIRGAGTS
jgi:hypothetical protein